MEAPGYRPGCFRVGVSEADADGREVEARRSRVQQLVHGTMCRVSTYDASPAALRPLLDAFWSPQGWRQPPALPTGRDLAQAVEAGVLFSAPRALDHDGWVAAAQAAAAVVTPEEVAEAFVASLPGRRLDLRSALGSYAVARRLPAHAFAASQSKSCAVCGLPEFLEQDLNVLNFERFKWGGVRRDHVEYVAFDLEQFRRAPREAASAEAVKLGRELLTALRSAGASDTATTLAAGLRMLKGNKAEREVLLDILGVCGVLQTAEHTGYLASFVPWSSRELPPQRFVERKYPVCWWRGADGVNEAAVGELLPSLL